MKMLIIAVLAMPFIASSAFCQECKPKPHRHGRVHVTPNVVIIRHNVHKFCWTLTKDDGTVFKGEGFASMSHKAWRVAIQKACAQLAAADAAKDGEVVKMTIIWRGRTFVRNIKIRMDNRKEWPIWEMERQR